jgi:ABC-type amino acid transport substrate-binding protein
MADKLGVKLQVQDMQFTSIIPNIQNGEYDIAIAAMYDTAARREAVLMSDSYCDSGMILAVKEGSKYEGTIKTLADCDGLKVAVKSGATSEKVAQDFLDQNPDVNYEVIGYEDTVGCVSDLLADRVDVVVNDLLNHKELSKQYPDAVIVSDALTHESNAVAVQKGKDDLM